MQNHKFLRELLLVSTMIEVLEYLSQSPLGNVWPLKWVGGGYHSAQAGGEVAIQFTQPHKKEVGNYSQRLAAVTTS